MNQLTIQFDITSYWHIGSGGEAGSYADALVLKDAYNLPYLPGKSIKGLFRDAFEKAIEAGWFAPNTDRVLFGQHIKDDSYNEGVIQFSSAQLSEAEQAFFNDQQSGEKINHLYRVIQSTKIDEQTGIADEGSFREIEVAIPMLLSASVRLNPQHVNYDQAMALINNDFQLAMQQVSSLIFAIGAKRQRGYGDVNINVVAQDA